MPESPVLRHRARFCYRVIMTKPPTQLDKFKKLARELEADEDETRWDERLKKVAAHKSPQEKPR